MLCFVTYMKQRTSWDARKISEKYSDNKVKINQSPLNSLSETVWKVTADPFWRKKKVKKPAIVTQNLFFPNFQKHEIQNA